ncbi:MAG TPA: hypothetical protein VGV68_01835 [Terriglobia bacterium]|nr:hypothetical protein [Terriglobia bacterium]
MDWALLAFVILVAVIAIGFAARHDPKLKRDLAVNLKGLGLLLIIGLIFAVGWVILMSTYDCFLADNFDYVTKRCALKHLQKPGCNIEQDILDVDEISDTSYKDDTGNRVETRSVIYQFKKRPVNGPVSADVLRDTQTLYKDAQGHWKASCER